jgi:hypothetical protein
MHGCAIAICGVRVVIVVVCCHRASDASKADIAAKVSPSRLSKLLAHFRDEATEALFEEVDVLCDLSREADIVRCLDPTTMYLGEPPLLASRIFERWSGEHWTDHGDL